MDKYIQIIAAFFGSLGFAILFNIRGKNLIWSAIGGMLDWSVYLLTESISKSEYFSYIMAALFLGVFSQIMAKKNKSPATVFLTVGFIPLIPGKALFLTMSNLFIRDWPQVITHLANSLSIAAAIASGVVLEIVVTNLYREIDKRRKK